MRWVLRVTCGSAQISSRVRSGPMPARLSAAATLTLAGKPRAPSQALPSIPWAAADPLEVDAVPLQVGRAGEALGGLRVTMVIERISPSAAARTASRPSSAPVGTTMRAPVRSARVVDQIPMLEHMADADQHRRSARPAAPAPATSRNTAAGRTPRDVGKRGQLGERDHRHRVRQRRVRRLLARPTSRALTATSCNPGTPRSSRRAGAADSAEAGNPTRVALAPLTLSPLRAHSSAYTSGQDGAPGKARQRNAAWRSTAPAHGQATEDWDTGP